ncbi:MAG: adenylyltransferase/cytidyltransferase family protein, partial [Methyloceanibacter sp.]
MPNPAKVAKPGVRSRNLPDSRADTDAYAIARALIETHVGPDRTIRSIGDFLLALADALKSAKDNQAGPRSTVVTFGTFDVFHYGHLRLLARAAQLGDRLVVGVSTDELSMAKKGRRPVYREQHRKAIVSALACVDGVFDERSMDEKPAYLH